MRNRLFISIVDKNSSKQFSIHKVARKIVLYTIIFLITFLIVGFVTMVFLIDKLRQIDLEKQVAIDDYKKVYFLNDSIKTQIDTKTVELVRISKKVEELEDIVSIGKNDDSLNGLSMGDLGELSGIQKSLILKLVPNGHPLSGKDALFSLKPLKGKRKDIYGIEYSAKNGEYIYATADGIVDISKDRVGGMYGRHIKIVHSFGFTSIYANLGKNLVKKGTFVSKGDPIGYAGNSNVYYEVRFLGNYLNSGDFIKWNETNFDAIFKNNSVEWKNLIWALDDLIQLQNYRLSNVSGGVNE